MNINEQAATSVKLINDITLTIQKLKDDKQCLHFKDILKQCLLEQDETMFIVKLKTLNNVLSKQNNVYQ